MEMSSVGNEGEADSFMWQGKRHNKWTKKLSLWKVSSCKYIILMYIEFEVGDLRQQRYYLNKEMVIKKTHLTTVQNMIGCSKNVYVG